MAFCEADMGEHTSGDAAPSGALLLFCGLPAAGKSTLARQLLVDGPEQLLQHLAPRGVRAVRVWHICFDAVLEALQSQRGTDEFDPVLWRESRDLVLAAVGAFFAAAEPRLELPCAIHSEACGDECAPCMHVLVLDDNMHYRSMRRTYYRLARDARVAVCTLGLPISLELALARNAPRPAAQRVAEATIRGMAEALQWPQPEVHRWERGWLQLAEPPPEEPQQPPLPWQELAAALAESVPSGPTEAERAALAEAAAASAAQTASSAAHQLDLRLRKTTSELMRRLAALPAAQRGTLARVLSELKKQVLLRRKERWVQRGAPGELDEELEAASDELHAAFGLVDLDATRSP